MTLESWRSFIAVNWDLGFTAFGGPPVHFKIVSLGSVQEITLPGAAYAFLSGLNAGVVGVIALATTELSGKAVTDDVTRLIVFSTASAGMLYKAIWFFPALMALSGLSTLAYDLGPPQSFLRLWDLGRWRKLADDTPGPARTAHESPRLGSSVVHGYGAVDQRDSQLGASSGSISTHSQSDAEEGRVIPRVLRFNISLRTGIMTISSFIGALLVVMIVRVALPPPLPRLYALFANMFLAGTIIFGGGPVVIPLLREYVVAEGWVSQRDFLIGLAIIQAFPGPNFNIAVFLGSLTAANVDRSPLLGAIIAWVGIFAPGMILVHGTMGIWSTLRSRPAVKAMLRGINAGATGLIYTAVYRIWQVGFLNETAQQGRSLGDEPWWLVVAAANYVFGRWYQLSPPITIITSALMSLIRCLRVQRWVMKPLEKNGGRTPYDDDFRSQIASAKILLRMVRYTALNPGVAEFRLLELLPGRKDTPIRCTLRVAALNDKPKFEALSYVWGDPTVTRSIAVDGDKFQATTNLEMGLRELRYRPRIHTLWVDAICIN
ncbi:hypothetical protein OQA88_11737 [Cercophora sp. LCS_1]